RDGFHATEGELREFVRGRIADYKVPERILFLPSLPKGLTGKIQRRELKEMMILSQQPGARGGNKGMTGHNGFYQKGCQEKSSASTGVERFSRDPAHDS